MCVTLLHCSDDNFPLTDCSENSFSLRCHVAGVTIYKWRLCCNRQSIVFFLSVGLQSFVDGDKWVISPVCPVIDSFIFLSSILSPSSHLPLFLSHSVVILVASGRLPTSRHFIVPHYPMTWCKKSLWIGKTAGCLTSTCCFKCAIETWRVPAISL